MLNRKRFLWLALAAGAAGLFVSPFLVPREHAAGPAQSAASGAAKALEALKLNNLGIAYMDQQRPQDALKCFQEASAAEPKNYIPRLNQGIALLNTQRSDDARAILTEAAKSQPSDAHIWYNLGLLEKSVGNPEAAVANFEKVAAIDPGDADTHYFMGLLNSQLHQYPKAIEEFQKAVAINAFHLSAEFGMAQAYQRSGDTANAKIHLERFQHLNSSKLGAPMSLIYGEQGKYSLAEAISSPAMAPTAAIPVHFQIANEAAGLPTTSGTSVTAGAAADSGVCVFDFDGNGMPDIFLTNATGDGQSAFYRHEGGGHFADVTKSAGLAISGAVSCAAGDYDNDGHADLAVGFSGRIALYRNQGDGTFRDVTETAGIHSTISARGMTFVDFDHDGDLDLYVTSAPATGASSGTTAAHSELWRNNGNGTFTNWSAESGLGIAASGVTVSDINNDRAIDFVTTSAPGQPTILFNPREGQFNASQPWASGMPAGSNGVAVFDFDKDGWMDVAFTHPSAPAVTLWRNVNGKRFEPVALPKLDWTEAWGVAAIDYDNDGWIDLAAVGEDASGGKIALFRNEGPAGFRDVTKDVGLDKTALSHPRAVVPFDYDGDGGVDLLITQANAAPVLLRNIGGSKNHWLRVTLTGTNDNKSAIGTKVEVFAGAMRQKFEVAGATGYLGQGPAEIHAGLGTESAADVVRLLWPTGVLQDEIHVEGGARKEITEIDRRGSSCPIVFVWNGSRYEFLADMIGPGIVGHWIAPGQRDVPDPDEYLKVNGSQVALHDGKISFRMLEPMEELDYLDRVRLLAIDHPSDVEVYPNERFASNPPFPEFKVIASRNAHAPARAWDDRGSNVLPLLLERDRKYVADFPSAPYQGFAAMHTLELDLGEWDASRPLRLLLDGFTDYFTANSMYAAWQAGIQPVAPYVEAQDAAGKWTRVVDDMGFPAGLARTMVADLTGKLPPGTRRIRIVTNLKIYWDRIRIDSSSPEIPFRTSEVPLADARLGFRGYPQVVEGNPKDDIRYVYENVSATGPYTRQAGYYTRYGDVKELVAATDNKYVIFGSGDEVAVNFDPSKLPPVPEHWTRDYFFYADGFAKDMDFYAAYGDTVSPLPFHTLVPYPYPSGIGYPLDAEHLNYILNYNTRPVTGPAGPNLLFHYAK
ncbi:MAG: FG-GAP-like repeat-containing protein [Candidatus Acidiferrales bacterium]|jgi:Flp pilus assembly protein TadD